ncbi:MAG: PD-(D/E)XK nuclease family protein [Vampirovibrionales bacterium]
MMMSLLPTHPLVFSADQLKSWSRCQKQFQYKTVEHRRWPVDTRRFRLGKQLHKWLEYQADGLPVHHCMAGEKDLQLIACWEQLQASPLLQWPVVASEYPFYVPLVSLLQSSLEEYVTGLHATTVETPPLFCHGRIDRLALRPASQEHPETLVLLDWKTGTAVPNYPLEDWQYMLYTLAIERLLQAENTPLRHPVTRRRLPDTIPLTFIYVQVSPQGIQCHEYPWSPQESVRVQQALLQTVTSLIRHWHQGDFSLPRTCPDNHCAYEAICGIRSLSSSGTTSSTVG